LAVDELGVLARRAEDQTGFGTAVEYDLLIRMRLNPTHVL
jgi:hypothetical protein